MSVACSHESAASVVQRVLCFSASLIMCLIITLTFMFTTSYCKSYSFGSFCNINNLIVLNIVIANIICYACM